MKKFFGFLFLSSLVLNIYLINTEVSFEETVSDNFDRNYRAIPRAVIEEDAVELAQAAVKKTNCDCKKSSAKADAQLSDEELAATDQELSDKLEFNEEEYQKASQEFYEKANKKIAEYLEYNAGLNYEQVEQYYNLREERQKEIDIFVQNRFNELEKNGAKHLFLSLEDTVEMGKINQKYLEKFKNSIGSDAYEMYQGFKERLNTQTQDNNRFAFFIDF